MESTRRALLAALLAVHLGACIAQTRPVPTSTDLVCDVAVYGATSAGLIAAIQAAREGRCVVVLEPSEHIGGLTTGGLGQTDIGNKAAVGGLSREFYRRMKGHYGRPDAWIHQARGDYRGPSGVSSYVEGDGMWTFEPSAASAVLAAWLEEEDVQVLTGWRLDRKAGVAVEDGRIEWIRAENRIERCRGRVFIDATYEGDLMAAAGVAYTVGRESNAEFGETLNGVQTAQATHHQFVPGVDPYVIPGEPTSGLLPGIEGPPPPDGTGDARVQAYCIRMCLTDAPENRLPWVRPEGYDVADYELLLRDFEAGQTRAPLYHGHLPNRKTDTNNNRAVSIDFIGGSASWPEASYAERDAIRAEHLAWQAGLMWTLAHHERVPEPVRQEVCRWGLCRDEFAGGLGWQSQLYVREARRMRGEIVMTEHHCVGRAVAADPVGLAAYTMDSHNVQRHLGPDGTVRNEGDVQVGGFPPYPIGYGAIVPREEECSNLLVPVCLSATHIAFGSIRMEPVFMVLGQSAAVAAGMAIDGRSSVQGVDRDALGRRLVELGQAVVWEDAAERAPAAR
ncbi:MAG: FAD-dependent oxidoreductase [Planctomycetota bacterium]